MLEEERKYQVDERFTMPDLAGCVPVGGRLVSNPPATLRATYYDTPDLRLARAGVSLRHRKGETTAKAWTAKLPSDLPGTRHEICRPGSARSIPTDLVSLLTVFHRGVQLRPAVVLRTVRRTHEIRDAQDRLLVEIADDAVSVLERQRIILRFHEVEVERMAGRPKLLDKLEGTLRAAGARRGAFVPKHIRALGPPAAAPSDVPACGSTGRRPSAADAIAVALRRDVLRVLRNDPLVRLRQPLREGDTPVHQMRVGCRRLRSDLRTFRPLLDRDWAGKLRADLRWIADALGAARDAEVLRARLHRTAATDPLAPLEPASVARIDADLAARHEEALVVLDEMLDSPRYLTLLEAIVDAANRPKLDRHAAVAAQWALPPIVAKPWRRLVEGGVRSLGPEAPDSEWHAVRILGKRARYATEAVATVLGGAASELAGLLTALQDLLGEHQDAVIAGDTWLAIAASDPDDHALAITAGRLYERERAAVRRSRQGFDPLWQAATRKRITAWLR
ncbi:MAG: CYTH and CHAD domain-containing protein [Micromonosporaceae bacterium]|nr:CYTH and CHAD domain-containing protein [Micromonosporaceae bacterium]